MNLDQFKFNFRLMLQEIKKRGINIRFVGNTNIIEASLEQHIEYLIDYKTRLIPGVYLSILDDKFYAKEFMREKGFTVVPGAVFHPLQLEEAICYASQIGYPVVLKPTNAGHGDLVFVNLKNESSFSTAFKEFSNYTNSTNMLVEKYYEGDDCRFFVVGDSDLAIVKRTLPSIIGDGVSSIRDLVENENYKRMHPRINCLCPIYIDDNEGKRVLEDQQLTPDSILQKNQKIVLRYNANVSWGAECENVIDLVHPSYLKLAKSIHALFPGSCYTVIDLLVNDITHPVASNNYAFCEFNSTPGFSLHHMPSKGVPHLILRSIIDVLFPETV